jgi:tryptophanyl-tRNA synthetase
VLQANLMNELTPIRERAHELQANPGTVSDALELGAAKARVVAQATITDVKNRMRLPLAQGAA